MSETAPQTNSAAQSIDPAKFDKKNIRFEPIVWASFGESKTPYGRTNMKYALADGRLVPLILRGPPMNTYGVSDNKDEKTKEVTGHSVCFNLPKGGSAFDKAITDVHMACCEYIATNAQACGLDPSAVDSAQAARVLLKCPAEHPKNKDTKKIETGKPKRMYAKLVEYRATETREGKMVTIFDNGLSWNPTTRKMESQLDPLSVRSNVEMIPSIQIDGIYFGSKPSIQIKLPRAAVTRALEANTVEAEDSAVGDYLTSLGLTSGGGFTEGGEATQDPAALL